MASKHLAVVSKVEPVHNIHLHTDATQIEGSTAIEWLRLNHARKCCKIVHEHVHFQDAELQAIVLALEKGADCLPRLETTSLKIWVYTDWKSGLTERSRCNSRNRTFHNFTPSPKVLK